MVVIARSCRWVALMIASSSRTKKAGHRRAGLLDLSGFGDDEPGLDWLLRARRWACSRVPRAAPVKIDA